MDKLQFRYQVFRIDEQGTIIFKNDGTNLTWNTGPCHDYIFEGVNDTGPSYKKQHKILKLGRLFSQNIQLCSLLRLWKRPGLTEQAWVSNTGSKDRNKFDYSNMNTDNAR